MKAVLLKAPGEIVFEEVPIPQISEDEVLVEVKICGICGSDLGAYRTAELFKPGTFLGHEFSGVIAEVGNKVEDWKQGDRVVVYPMYICGECYACKRGRLSECEHGFEHAIGSNPGREEAGAFAKFVRVTIPQKRLYSLPEGVSFEEGALVEPLACSLHAVRMSAFRLGDKTMVLGAGVIGLGVIAHLKTAGAGLIIAVEPLENRAEVASQLGADYVFNPQNVPAPKLKEEVLKLTNGIGIDVVFDCSGIPGAFQNATSFLRRGGQVLVMGIITTEVPIVPVNWVMNEWGLQFSMCYWIDEWPIVIELLRKGVLPFKEMITSKIKLGDIVEQGFNKLLKPGHKEIKILVEPD